MLKRTTQILLSLFIAASLFYVPSVVRSQEVPPVAAAPQQAEDTGEKKNSLFEQTIYVPYDKLSKVFESPARGVFLPYDEFQKLWQAARAKNAVENPVSIPLRSMITSISSEAIVRGDVMQVSAKLSIQMLGLGWHEIPLRLADAAISEANIGDETARIIFRPGQGYFLLMQRQESDAADVVLDLQYARTYNQSPGLNQVSFQAPQASINRWKITIADPGVKVNVQPLVAATETQDGAARDNATGDPSPPVAPATETVLIAFFGLTPQVHIDWTPRSEGAAGLQALATVQTRQSVVIGEGSQRTQAQLVYSITRSELRELKLRIPVGQKISGVFDANVRRWDVALEEGNQIITIELFEPADSTQTINIELERFDLEVGMQNESVDVIIPEIEALNVSRQQGLVMVKVEGDLRADVDTRTGLLQVDAAEVNAGQGWDFVYRYAALPYELILKIEKLQPRVTVEEYVTIQITPQLTRMSVTTLLDIQRAGLFHVDYDVPEGYRIRSVRGIAAANVKAAVVENHHAVENAPGKYRVNFSRKAVGQVALLVSVEKVRTDVNLLTPTSEASQYTFALPRIVAASVEHVQGNVTVLAPEGLRVTPVDTAGGQSVAISEVQPSIAGLVQLSRVGSSLAVHAFRYANESFNPTFSVERRQPQIEVGQLVIADVQSGIINHSVTLAYDVRYSGVKKLRLDIPTSLIEMIRNDSKLVQESVITPRPDDLADDYTAWQLTSNRELFGQFQVELSWIESLEDLEVGSAASVSLHPLMPQEVHRSWGQIVIKKTENLDVVPAESDGVRPIDPRYDLKLGSTEMQVPGAAVAMEFHQTWSVKLDIHRYELESIELSAIELGVIDVQIAKGGKSRVHAVYRVKSAAQRIAVTFPQGSKIPNDPLSINGEAVGIEKGTTADAEDAVGNQKNYLIPLNTTTPGEDFVLELKYSIESDGFTVRIPEFKDLHAINQIFMVVHLPSGTVLVDYSGDWDDHLPSSFLETIQRNLLHDSETEGIVDVHSLLNNITQAKVDVQLGNQFSNHDSLIFSAINPSASPLRLSTVSLSMFHLVMFGVLVVVTFGGLRLGIRNQIITVLVLVSASLGVVLIKPIMASHMPFSGLFLGMGLMCVIWVIKDCLKPCFRICRKLFSLDTVGEADQTLNNAAEDATDVENTAVDEAEDLEAASESQEDSLSQNDEEQDADEIAETLSPAEDSQAEPDEFPDDPVSSDDDNSNREGDE
ncbi:MAG: hypothetical protein HOF72_14180 [Planctomycetaceae bacterium]|jgi:hypothetical protein|nr:hypothetical protein [Planctomycetaceae bacterium]MBT4011650.1 hypothetical protein [Planctomycetaceae bacterium]MBT4723799.1 hypothetical protein [Planctomycetaceae bacterium]MBT5126361.1 hypothetical protein [Planctomycetaceae bacterium]MBT7256174.1 hypothetical protein [Planctomycetaceae bacterium]